MTTTAQTQANITTLKDRLKDFEEKIARSRTDVESKRKATGKALLEGRDSSPIEEDISKIENRINSLLAAKAEGERQLSEATSTLEAGKKADAQERMNEIALEVDRAGIDLEKTLKGAKESAEAFTSLISEAWVIHSTVRVPLSPIASWINISPPHDPGNRVEAMLNIVLERVRQHKPKE